MRPASAASGRPFRGEYRNSKWGERAPGTIDWAEHLEAFAGYAAKFGTSQSAQRLAERGGFGYGELVEFLGHDPVTWQVATR